jgi:hypothetical protein
MCKIPKNAKYQVLTENAPSGPCSISRIRGEFLIQTLRAVRFWGHDSAMEWSFFVTEDALKRLQPNM